MVSSLEDDWNDEPADDESPAGRGGSDHGGAPDPSALFKLPKIQFPTPFLSESFLKSFEVMSRAVRKQAYDRINTADVVASLSAHRATTDALLKNVDFGEIAKSLKVATGFNERQTEWLKNLVPAFSAMRTAFYPANLCDIPRLMLADVRVVILDEGIALYGIPRREIAETLIRADDAAARRSILEDRWRDISADCREAIEACTSEEVALRTPFALKVLDALDAGHVEAAQSLAASLLDTVVTAYFGDDRTTYTPDRRGKRTNDAYDDLAVRQFLAFAPLWNAYQQFDTTDDGVGIPSEFSRHCSVHAVHPDQYTLVNAVQAVMFVCSLISRIDEEAAARDEAEAA